MTQRKHHLKIEKVHFWNGYSSITIGEVHIVLLGLSNYLKGSQDRIDCSEGQLWLRRSE
jgi:hypothetical protein